jgi:TRAP-type C4-dicarboxylate transport system substrate-binding protein
MPAIRNAICQIALGFLTSTWITTAMAQEAKHYRFAYDQPKTTGYGIAGDLFANKLKELSGGSILIDQYPGAQLGQEPQVLQLVKAGDVEFCISSSANAATLSPQAGVMSLHYLFRSEDHLVKALSDPQVTGAVRSLRPDVSRLRRPNSPYAVGSVYTSLQTGVVDVAENGVNVYLANKHYEVAPVLSMTEHEANNNLIWISDKLWKSLSGEQKKWVQTAADEVNMKEPAMAFGLEHQSADKLKTIGVSVVEKVDKSGFQKLADPYLDKLAGELGPHATKIKNLILGVK